jgi:hypothetical protein
MIARLADSRMGCQATGFVKLIIFSTASFFAWFTGEKKKQEQENF